ncbi:hypothetical protein K4B79_36940 [Streptomyces lincolnensis]|uniref:hypothetical protein n=2 Tax=Streptomyces TaxID=1883 RepID=UPI001E5AEA07|nr:hypothetical protein [Streptomyces lincolnensis]MCD7443780.1 hypothetical protein [Streptomyces lincolnensis]
MSDNTLDARDALDTLDDRARGAWAAPLISTLVTVPACLVAYLVGGFSAMACDSCDGTRADRFESSFGIAFPVLLGGLGIALFLVAASWALPWERGNTARRVGLAAAAPFMVPFAYVVFAVLVDWP